MLMDMLDPQPARHLQDKIDLYFSNYNKQVTKDKYMAFSNNASQDLQKLINEI